MTDLVAFDFETTGLHPMKHKIVEVGAVRFDVDKDNEVIDTFQTFVNPGAPIPAEVIKIHGITDAMVAGAPSEREVIPRFLKFIGDSPLIAHNISFDVGFLMATAAIYKIRVSSNLLIDSCELSRICFKDAPNHKLSTIGKYLNLDQSGYHRALADSLAVMKLYQKCLEKLSARTNQLTIKDIAHRTTGELTFNDYVFDRVAIPADKMALKTAMDNSLVIEIRYCDGQGEESQRKISPFSIFSYCGKTYVAALCHQTGEFRKFRLDRVKEIVI